MSVSENSKRRGACLHPQLSCGAGPKTKMKEKMKHENIEQYIYRLQEKGALFESNRDILNRKGGLSG